MSRETFFTTYLNNLISVARQGDAREESFYPALASMLEEVAHATGRKHVHVTTLPKPTEGGNPDFRLWNGTDRIIGYQDFEAVAKLASVTELLIGEGQQTPVSIAFFTYSCA